MRKTSCSVFSLVRAKEGIKNEDERCGVLLLRWKRCTFKCSTTSHSKGNCICHIRFAKKTLRWTLQNTRFCTACLVPKRNAETQRTSFGREAARSETRPFTRRIQWFEPVVSRLLESRLSPSSPHGPGEIQAPLESTKDRL